MKVIDFIKENGFNALTEELGIKVKYYDDCVVLNYSQINSPKTHPVVCECRGLILNKKTLEILARPFERFFNYGEAPENNKDFDLSRAVAYDKIDGSLIKIWCNNGIWKVGTKGTAYAESTVNEYNITFEELVYNALNISKAEFEKKCSELLKQGYTYLFEVTSLENRVVTKYKDKTLWFLGCIENYTGKDFGSSNNVRQAVFNLGAKIVKERSFKSIEDCLSAAAALPDLKEGYVLYDKFSNVRIKVKSPAYVAVHHIRGEGLNPKRIKQLVLTNEQDEYLKYFPDDSEHIYPFVQKLRILEGLIVEKYIENKNHESQKDFALSIKDFCFSCVLFQARARNEDPIKIWNSLEQRQRYNIFSNFVD